MTVRVGTWNLEHARGAIRQRRQLDVLHALDADIWVLTETTDRVDLGRGYSAVHSTPASDCRDGERWISIWSRLPIVRAIPTRRAERTVAAEISAGQACLLAYGTVLPWQTDPGYGPTPSRNWTEHYEAILEQGADWVELGRANPGAPLVVAGDFNTQLGGPRYYGTAHGQSLVRDALARARLSCLTESNRVPPGLVAYPLIDHICASAEIGCRELEAWEGAGNDGYHMSDHSGVVAALEL